MRPILETIPLGDALAIALDSVTPIDRTERLPLGDAAGRVLAEAIVADADVPPFDRAAMDGFAVRAEDTGGAAPDAPVALRCVDTIYTGRIPTREIGTGECAEIATGAPLPPGANAVVMVEETDRADGSPQRPIVQIMKAARPRQNIGPRAADIALGDALLAPGDLLTPSRIGVCAAAGRAEVDR